MNNLGRNLILLVFVAASAFILFFIGCPWLVAIGHPGLCYVFFAVLIVVLLYARAGAAPRKRSSQ
jgi:uncharacterized membrane protein YkvI